MSIKEKVHAALTATLAEKIDRLRQNLTDLRASAANETKSTAGDKYETALAMLQEDIFRANFQLQKVLEQAAATAILPLHEITDRIAEGSLVKTDRALFYIVPGGGKITAEGISVICVSPHSALGIKLCAAKKNDTVTQNGSSHVITEIS